MGRGRAPRFDGNLDSAAIRDILPHLNPSFPMRTLLLPAILVPLLHAAEIRTWTDVESRTVEASLVRLEGDSVVLRLRDGREVPYPLARLSEADRRHAAAEALNFDAPWPERIRYSEDPEIATVEENPDHKRFVYESANYRFTSDVRLAKSVVKGFAVLFEATQLYCRTLPLGCTGGVKTNGKYRIELFEKSADYEKAGGQPNSAGVFIPSREVVLIQLDSLGVKPVGSGYMLDRDKSSKTVPHELTHQLSPPWFFAPEVEGWFVEGFAEYVARTPYRSGSFDVRGNQKAIVAAATGTGADGLGGWALGTDITMPPLEEFMTQDYRGFQSRGALSYGCALLLTNYFFNADGDGDARRIKAFLNALREGKKGGEALKPLLDGRSYRQLEAEFARDCKRKGVEIRFSVP